MTLSKKFITHYVLTISFILSFGYTIKLHGAEDDNAGSSIVFSEAGSMVISSSNIHFDGSPQVTVNGVTHRIIDGEQNIITCNRNLHKRAESIARGNSKLRMFVAIGKGAKIGSNLQMEKGSEIKMYAIIGDNVTLEENSIIGIGAKIGDNATLEENSIIGMGAIIGNNVTLEENSIIGTGAIIGDNVIIRKRQIIEMKARVKGVIARKKVSTRLEAARRKVRPDPSAPPYEETENEVLRQKGESTEEAQIRVAKEISLGKKNIEQNNRNKKNSPCVINLAKTNHSLMTRLHKYMKNHSLIIGIGGGITITVLSYFLYCWFKSFTGPILVVFFLKN